MLKYCYLLPCVFCGLVLSFVCTFYTRLHILNKPDQFTSNSQRTDNDLWTNNEWASEPNEPIRTMNEQRTTNERKTNNRTTNESRTKKSRLRPTTMRITECTPAFFTFVNEWTTSDNQLTDSQRLTTTHLNNHFK